MNSEVLKEFQVLINFKVDGDAERRMQTSMQGAVLNANLLASAIEATARIVTESIKATAAGFERLFYVSERTSSSVENIRAFSYAISQMGGTVDGARSSLESFAQRLRANPGYENQLNALGVRTRNADQSERDRVEVLRDFGRRLSRMRYDVALQYGNRLGIDEVTLRALMKGVGSFEEEYRRKARLVGLDNEKAAVQFRDLERAASSLGGTISAVVEKIAADLAPHITKALKEIDEWLLSHPKQIQESLNYLADTARHLAEAFHAVTEAARPAWQAFDKVGESLGQNGLTLAMELFATYMATKWIARILTAFLGVRTGAAALLGGLGLAGAAGLAVGGLAAAGGLGLGDANNRDAGVAAQAESRRGKIRDWMKKNLPGWMTGWMGNGGGLTDKYPEGLADATQTSAKDLGISAHDLATVMSYETSGTFDPMKVGPTTKWGQHMGLIQWGEAQRQKYGIRPGMSVGEQMKAVTRYLRDAGVRPGMGLLDVYSAVNAGRVGRYGASDRPGMNVASHVERMQREHSLNAARMLSTADRSVPVLAQPAHSDALVTTKKWDKLPVFARAEQQPLMNESSKGGTNVVLNQKTNTTVFAGEDQYLDISRYSRRTDSNVVRNTQGAIR